MFLARLLTELLPHEPEPCGLLALLLHAEARREARRDAAGEFVPFAEQDPGTWNGPMILAAEAMLRRAARRGVLGRYQLEAALQSAHVYRRRTGQNNWAEVLRLYDALAALTASPVVAVNRALALAEVHGPAAALATLAEVAADARLGTYQPFWAARADLLVRTGAHREAGRAYDIAVGLERDPAVRRFLQRQRAAATPSGPDSPRSR